MGKAGQKLCLLLWKNFTLQRRSVLQTVGELLIPLIFTLILVLLRSTVNSHAESEKNYPVFAANESAGSAVSRGRAYGKTNYILYVPPYDACTSHSANLTSCLDEVDNVMARVEARFGLTENDLTGDRNIYKLVKFGSEKSLLLDYESAETYKQDQLGPLLSRLYNENPVFAAVIFKSYTEKGCSYIIRLPAGMHIHQPTQVMEKTLQPLKTDWATEFLYELFPIPRDREYITADDRSPSNPLRDIIQIDKLHGGSPGYWREGFLFFQHAIDTEIIKMRAGQQNISKDGSDFDLYLRRYPYPSFNDDGFHSTLQFNFPMFMMFSFIYANINIARSIDHEKEKRLKETMKIMGLPNWLHWTAWFIKSYVFLAIPAIMLAGLCKISWGESYKAILRNTDFSVLTFVFLSNIFPVITLAFFVSTICWTANSGAAVSGVLYFITFFPDFFMRPRYKDLTRHVKLGVSVFSNSNFAIVCSLITRLEGSGPGLQWWNIGLPASPDDDICVLDLVYLLWFDGFLYFMLALYIESVFPGQFGVPLPWYYPFTIWYWCGKPQPISHSYDVTEEQSLKLTFSSFESEPEGYAGIQIQGLTKVFHGKVAVNNVSLNFYENQVTALLGHNGAGKTTTMSMLIGLFPPTHGTAIVNGFDIRSDIANVRSSIGICPQYDVLFDQLTVQEHLQFFSMLKGFDRKCAKEEINRILSVINLEEKRHAKARSLSGGMKRKLSVGIAFIGGSKVVLLDEPTSGMDPSARRSTWDLITNEKQNRTIVLTTHFMDEADVLGDRIAIMAEGQVRCCGSSLFLKKKYGGGYHLIIAKSYHCQVEVITKIIQKHIPEVEVGQNIGAELSYSLPDGMSSVFPAIFQELEDRKDELGIESYGCSITEMEEVFMRVGYEAGGETLAAKSPEEIKTFKPLPPPSIEAESWSYSKSSEYQDRTCQQTSFEYEKYEFYSDDRRQGVFYRNQGCHLILQQFRAMMIKNWLYTWRNQFFTCSQIIIPVFFLVATMLTFTTLPDIANPCSRQIDLQKYVPTDDTITVVKCESSPFCNGTRLKYEELIRKRKSTVVYTNKDDITNYILRRLASDQSEVNTRYVVALDFHSNRLTGWFNNQPYHTPPLALNLLSNTLARHVLGRDFNIMVTNHPLPYRDSDLLNKFEDTQNEGYTIGFILGFGMSFLAGSFVVVIVKERESQAKHLQFVSGLRYPIFYLTSWVTHITLYVICVFLLMAGLIIVKAKDFSGENSYMLGFFFIVMIAYAWAIIPFMYLCSFMFTSSSGAYTKMCLFNFLSGLITFFTLKVLKLEVFQLEFVANGLEWAFMIFPNFAVAYSLSLLTINRQIRNMCGTFLNVLHSAGLSCSMEGFTKKVCCSKYKYEYMSLTDPGIGRHLLFLIIVGIFSWVGIVLIESHVIEKIKYILEQKRYNLTHNKDDKDKDDGWNDTELIDDDVDAENRRIRDRDVWELFATDNLVIRDLTKYYGDFLAVDKLCLGVQHAECFGLLGINGAGKTTTFKMLTGDHRITAGDAFMATRSVKRDILRVQHVIGYCPQFDALIPELTGRETIYMFARLRGIPEQHIDMLAEELAKDLIFRPHLDKPCGTYSGGNKRKLSVAVAVLGNPPILFLDEPTTGMDPVARRHLWNAVIKTRKRGASIILTSHSMEECEALCTRLAIMVNGKFRCLGSPQHLKNKFGDGFTLIAQLRHSLDTCDKKEARYVIEAGRRAFTVDAQHEWENELIPLRDFIEDNFPRSELKEIHPGYVHYHIRPGGDVSWSLMFQKMEEAKQRLNIEAYSVGQPSLEQIFLSFTKAQVDAK